MTASSISKPTALYRHYDAENVLLYIGVSINPIQRTDQHIYSSEWTLDVKSIEIEWHENGYLARSAEMIAIRNEHPLHNSMHSKTKTWQRNKNNAYIAKFNVDTLADYISVTDESSSKVLAYFIKSINNENLVSGTYPRIAKETGVSESTIARTIQKLLDGKFIKKIQTGVYMVSPNLIRYGSKTVGVIQMKLWMNA